jgi:hypothetical protein
VGVELGFAGFAAHWGVCSDRSSDETKRWRPRDGASA